MKWRGKSRSEGGEINHGKGKTGKEAEEAGREETATTTAIESEAGWVGGHLDRDDTIVPTF
ncbi:MAG TPA: hypothetical protein VE177_01275 [Candidatus Binatus sp.]|nr:hypothetical protein [Candidatus Binatus sp.]